MTYFYEFEKLPDDRKRVQVYVNSHRNYLILMVGRRETAHVTPVCSGVKMFSLIFCVVTAQVCIVNVLGACKRLHQSETSTGPARVLRPCKLLSLGQEEWAGVKLELLFQLWNVCVNFRQIRQTMMT